ncbi:hypothetical protein SSX86_026449 [Deinandra increscens subsp. villosa]|uniref:S-acyltransferase n=1 Tax=Deinandra increscens subsp. villosa TaxID=3103831 RepID=A0AAP0GN31_9ASTR
MEDSGRRRKRRDPWRLIGRSTVSVVCVFFTQFALYLLSSFFDSSNTIALLFLSGSLSTYLHLIYITLRSYCFCWDLNFDFKFFCSVMVLLGMTVIGRRCKKLFGLRGSAPAFVFTNILFIWCVYLVAVRQATSFLLDIIFYAELIILLIGLYSIISGDPGFVDYGPLSNTETYLESSFFLQRVRYCKHCHAHIKGFDHHCPAFGNCIGQNNHLLFIFLLAGFITTEACYIIGASQSKLHHTFLKVPIIQAGWTITLATSTMIFSILQVIWQAAFLAWHIYCVCFNIRTDEWIHWKIYPEFQHIIHSQPGETGTATRFRNPYDKGIWQNLKEFIEAKG